MSCRNSASHWFITTTSFFNHQATIVPINSQTGAPNGSSCSALAIVLRAKVGILATGAQEASLSVWQQWCSHGCMVANAVSTYINRLSRPVPNGNDLVLMTLKRQCLSYALDWYVRVVMSVAIVDSRKEPQAYLCWSARHVVSTLWWSSGVIEAQWQRKRVNRCIDCALNEAGDALLSVPL